MENITRAIKALSDETRLRILNVVSERECCVCEVMQALEISQTRASRNLSMLHDAGFLTLRKDGLWVLYSINKEASKLLQGRLLKAIREDLSLSKTAGEDTRRLHSSKRLKPPCASCSS